MVDLTIGVRSLTGTFHGSDARTAREWPPSPFRLFQALRAGLGAASTDSPALQALFWLETLGAPAIEAPAAQTMSSYTLYVMNNDIDSVKGDMSRVGKLRAAKVLKPQQFPIDAVVRYRWENIDGPVPVALKELVHRLHTFGLGIDAAYADCQVDDEADRLPGNRPGLNWIPSSDRSQAKKLPIAVPGSLARLEVRHEAWLRRLQQKGKQVHFSQPPMALYASQSYATRPSRLIVSFRVPTNQDRFVVMPATAADALVTAIGIVILKRFPDETDWLEKLVMGRGAGPRELAQRLRIVPLPSRGHVNADGQFRRALVEVPQGSRLQMAGIGWALDGELLPAAVDELIAMNAAGMSSAPDWDLSAQTEQRRSLVLSVETESVDDLLKRLGYARETRCWRSITPVVLPIRRGTRRAPAMDGQARVELEKVARRQLIDAVRHADLPKPVGVTLQREPFGPAGRPASEYALGTRFDAARMFHAELRFDESIDGPFLVGDGRFRGLGLFEAVGEDQRSVHAFAIEPSVPSCDREALLRQFRRALLARAQSALRASARLSEFFHGHDGEGGIARSGQHRHLYFRAVVDGEFIRSIEVILPNAVDRIADAPKAGEQLTLARAIDGFETLRFGSHVLRLVSTAPEPAAFATRFENRTRYVTTRRPRRGDDRAMFIERDVRQQLASIGLSGPAHMHVVDVTLRGDGLLEAKVTVEFHQYVSTPVMLGSDAHFGGGDFVPKPL